jgi:hypothetical protein
MAMAEKKLCPQHLLFSGVGLSFEELGLAFA